MLFISICLLKITAVVVVTFVGLHGIAVILVLFMVVVAALYERKEQVKQ